MNKIKEALRIAIKLRRLYPQNNGWLKDDWLILYKDAQKELKALQSSLNKLLGEMDDFSLIYCDNVVHCSGEASKKFCQIYNKLDLIIQGKEAYKSEELIG